MPIGNLDLTDIAVTQAESAPGMAHFAGTGPNGTYCATCEFLTPVKLQMFCKKYVEIMKRRGKPIRGGLKSCKYYKEKPTVRRY